MQCDSGSATSLPVEKAGWGLGANRKCPAGRLPSDPGVQGQLGTIGSTRLPQNEGPPFSPLSFPRFIFFLEAGLSHSPHCDPICCSDSCASEGLPPLLKFKLFYIVGREMVGKGRERGQSERG